MFEQQPNPLKTLRRTRYVMSHQPSKFTLLHVELQAQSGVQCNYSDVMG